MFSFCVVYCFKEVVVKKIWLVLLLMYLVCVFVELIDVKYCFVFLDIVGIGLKEYMVLRDIFI